MTTETTRNKNNQGPDIQAVLARLDKLEQEVKTLKESKVDDQTKFLKEKMSTVVSTQNKLNNRNQQLIHALQTQVQQLTNQLKRR